MRRASLAMAVIALAACQSGPTFSAADMQANQDLVNAWSGFLKAKNWDGLVDLYTENASVMPPNGPAIRGRAAIKAFMASFPPVKSFRAVDDTISGVGDLAYARGRYWMELDVPGASADSGKFIEVRRKQADGSWKLEIDMFSSNVPLPPPTPSKAAPSKSPAKSPAKAPAKTPAKKGR